MKQIKLSSKDRKELSLSVKKIIGQLQNINSVLEEDNVTEQTFNQLLAVKGGTSKVCKEIIARGVLRQINKFSIQELDQALNIIFKLD